MAQRPSSQRQLSILAGILERENMKVIKVVRVGVNGCKLCSSFARGEWLKEYAEGVKTKPDRGYLFAYSDDRLSQATAEMGGEPYYQYWLAEAEVAGEIRKGDIGIECGWWHRFWKDLKPLGHEKGVKYLLCSSITLIDREGQNLC